MSHYFGKIWPFKYDVRNLHLLLGTTPSSRESLTICRIALATIVRPGPALDGVGGAALIVEIDHVPVAPGYGIVHGLEYLVCTLGSPAARVRVLLGARNER